MGSKHRRAVPRGSISFTIKNQGILPAANNTATVTVGTTKLPDLPVPALAPGAEHSGVRPYTAPSQTALKITIFVDASREVIEADESNNERIETVTPAAPPPPPDPATETTAGGPAPTGAFLIMGILLAVVLVSRRRRHA